MINKKDLITAQALAEALNYSVDTIWRYTREKKIPYIELKNKQYRYRYDEVIAALAGEVVCEKPEDYKSDIQNKFSYRDYLELPDDPGYRYEIFDGVLIKDPAPDVMHQRASVRLFRILDGYFRENDPEGEIFYAPVDVTFGDYNVCQPDILFISGEQKEIIKEKRIEGSPYLVVEILSPKSKRKDRLQKMAIYLQGGVEHYWIVDPEDKTLECYFLQDGFYARVAGGMEKEKVEHPCLTGLSINLKSLWG